MRCSILVGGSYYTPPNIQSGDVPQVPEVPDVPHVPKLWLAKRITYKSFIKILTKPICNIIIIFVYLCCKKGGVMKYKILVSHSGEDLTRRVEQHIEDGWTPFGSHQVVVKHEQNRFRGTQHVDTLNELEYSQTIMKND
jgi:hypothetical protein